MNIVSLVPSVTETLLSWHIEPVACTRFCEQPDLHHVGGTKDPDVDAIVALGPDLVVMDEEENRLEDAEALAARGIGLHVTAVRSLADVAPTLAGLAASVGRDQQPVALRGESREQLQRAFVPIWRRPWMTINRETYGSSVLERIGVANVFAGEPSRYPAVESLDEARARTPDVVIGPSEPFPFAERHRTELEHVAPRVVFVDGRDLFWWGVRTPGAIERLSRALGLTPGPTGA